MKYYKKTTGEYPETDSLNNIEVIGNGWGLEKKENKCFLSFIAAAHGGKIQTIEITKQDYNLAKELKIDLDELCNKYGNSSY